MARGVVTPALRPVQSGKLLFRFCNSPDRMRHRCDKYLSCMNQGRFCLVQPPGRNEIPAKFYTINRDLYMDEIKIETIPEKIEKLSQDLTTSLINFLASSNLF